MKQERESVWKPAFCKLASFKTFSGTKFIKLSVIRKSVSDTFYQVMKYSNRKWLHWNQFKLIQWNHFSLKIRILKKSCFRCLASFCVMQYHIILHMCNRNKFDIAVLHWKQPMLCDKQCFCCTPVQQLFSTPV